MSEKTSVIRIAGRPIHRATVAAVVCCAVGATLVLSAMGARSGQPLRGLLRLESPAPGQPADVSAARQELPAPPPVDWRVEANDPDGPEASVSRVGAAARFNGHPLRQARTIQMVVTAYCPDAACCGKWAGKGLTASGYSIHTNGMKLVAADTRVLPFGTLLSVPGYHGARPVPVLDRGGAIKGNRLDLLFPSHDQAKKWGKRTLEVTVWSYAE